jgi:hypothetical protein
VEDVGREEGLADRPPPGAEVDLAGLPAPLDQRPKLVIEGEKPAAALAPVPLRGTEADLAGGAIDRIPAEEANLTDPPAG